MSRGGCTWSPASATTTRRTGTRPGRRGTHSSRARFRIPLPPGKYRLTAKKGYQYADWEGTVEVQAGQTAHADIAMNRLRDTEAQGWLCGDMHTHSRGVPLAVLHGEDVNVVANTFYGSNRAMPFPTYADRSDPSHQNFSNQEIEGWAFGNTFYFNIPHSVVDPTTPNPRPHAHVPLRPAGPRDGRHHRPLAARPAVRHRRPGAAGARRQHALGYMDVWTVLENGMQQALDRPGARWNGNGWGDRMYEYTYKTWYALMNCGLRIPISAGTSYGRLSRLGFNRVYAHVTGRTDRQGLGRRPGARRRLRHRWAAAVAEGRQRTARRRPGPGQRPAR